MINQTMGQRKPFGNRSENNAGNTNDNQEYQFLTPRKPLKMKKADTNKDFFSLNRFEILTSKKTIMI